MFLPSNIGLSVNFPSSNSMIFLQGIRDIMSNVKSSHWGQKKLSRFTDFLSVLSKLWDDDHQVQAVEGTMDFTSPGHLRKRAVPKLGQIWRCGESSNFEISILGIQYTRCKDSCGMDFTRMTIPFLHHVLSMSIWVWWWNYGGHGSPHFSHSPMKRVIDWGSIPQFSDKFHITKSSLHHINHIPLESLDSHVITLTEWYIYIYIYYNIPMLVG